MQSDTAYEHLVLKKYKHFSLFLHTDQKYLGRSYAWMNGEGEMQRFSNLSHEELTELQDITKEYERAAHALWQPDHMNYAWLGNFFHEHAGHGHLHIIPRYKTPRTFNGIKFVDENWGKNYPADTTFTIPQETLFAIRDALIAELHR